MIKIDEPDQVEHLRRKLVKENMMGNAVAQDRLLMAMWTAIDLPEAALDRIEIAGHANLPSAFPVTDLAAGAMGVAALAVSELVGLISDAPRVAVDRHLASIWFGRTIQPIGWDLPPAWDAIAGDYRSSDGWIRLHTNAPHHRAAALSVLGCGEDRADVSGAVERWPAEALETAIVAAGGCAAQMRSAAEWFRHPQGMAVSIGPLIGIDLAHDRTDAGWQPSADRPLAGVKVLDLTRVLAGPVATRFLAGYGADVLRIDPPGWDEGGVIPEVTLGKRCARLDLHRQEDRAHFERLLSQADILVHGYRPGALDALGYDEAHRRTIRPDLIDVSLNAYGWAGPWRDRRGFDSLLQMSAGIAAEGMIWKGSDRPTPLPVQALDHATGYLMAAAAIRGLIARVRGEGRLTARLSLAGTAALLTAEGGAPSTPSWTGIAPEDHTSAVEETAWGPARRIKAPVWMDGVQMAWSRPAARLGSAEPIWVA